MRSIVLFSGGMDSTIALHWALSRGEVAAALTIEYAQRHWVEIAQAKRIARRAKVRHEIEHLGGKGIGLGVALTDKSGPIQDAAAAVVPMRNLMFLSVAAAWAERLHADTIVTGFSKEDHDEFPDCRWAFVRAATDAISLSLDRPIRVLPPFLHESKVDALRVAKTLPDCWHALGLSWTCYTPDKAGPNTGHVRACGKCPACVRRAAAFEALGEPDPAAGKEFRG